MNFTPAQERAIDIADLGRDKCVSAGPGSGKTRVLVERFQRLVAAGIDPSRILAITFTEKAATEMKERLGRAFANDPQARRALERAWVSTVHGFCARLLKENAVFAAVDPEFRVADEREAAVLRAQAAREALDALYAEDPAAMRELMRALDGPRLDEALLAMYDVRRAAFAGERPDPPSPAGLTFDALAAEVAAALAESSAGWSASQLEALAEVREWLSLAQPLRGQPLSPAHFALIAECRWRLNGMKRSNSLYNAIALLKKERFELALRTAVGEYHEPQRALIVRALAALDTRYRELKRARAALDYEDLQEFATRLLRDCAPVRARVREQFEQVMMDEFQDTNGLQSALVDLVRAPGRFYAVGDINQSIYGFRHADPSVFRDYRDRVAIDDRVDLAGNFRSRAPILDFVETVLDGAAGMDPRRLSAGKTFFDKDGPLVEILCAQAETTEAAEEIEARSVAARLLDWAERLPLANSQDPLRARSAAWSDFAILMRNSAILPAFTRVFEQAGIPYLVTRGRGFYEAQEIRDLTNLLRVLVNPRDEIALAAVLRSPFAGASGEELLADARADRLGARLDRWRALRDSTPFDILLLRAMEETGYRFEPGSREQANVEKLLGQARAAYERLTLPEWVDELEFVRANEPREPDAPPEDAINAVRMMTVHAAKGLEFPVVFLCGAHKGIESRVADIDYSPRVGVGVRWRVPGTGGFKDDLRLNAIRAERRQREIEESNRLLYVAMTRAEEHLVVSFSREASRPKEWAGHLANTLLLNLEPGESTISVSAPSGRRVAVRVTAADRAPEIVAAGSEAPGARAPVPEIPEPRVTGQYESSASVTSVAMFADCPRRYFLQRYLGLEPVRRPRAPLDGEAPEPDEVDPSEFGRQVHSLLAGIEVPEAGSDARALAERFIKSEWGKRAAKAKTAGREDSFLLAIEDVVLRGQIDLWFEDGRDLVLIDYKTDEVQAADLAAHARRYELQLQLYALALREIAGREPTRALLYFLKPDAPAPVPVEPLFLMDAAARVRDFRDAHETLDFPLRVTPDCRRCPFYNGPCPARL